MSEVCEFALLQYGKKQQKYLVDAHQKSTVRFEQRAGAATRRSCRCMQRLSPLLASEAAGGHPPSGSPRTTLACACPASGGMLSAVRDTGSASDADLRRATPRLGGGCRRRVLAL